MIYYSLVFTDFYTNTSLIKICHIKMHIQIIHPRKQNVWPAVYNLWQKLLRTMHNVLNMHGKKLNSAAVPIC